MLGVGVPTCMIDMTSAQPHNPSQRRTLTHSPKAPYAYAYVRSHKKRDNFKMIRHVGNTKAVKQCYLKGLYSRWFFLELLHSQCWHFKPFTYQSSRRSSATSFLCSPCLKRWIATIHLVLLLFTISELRIMKIRPELYEFLFPKAS